jgi:hypothetical protein
MTRSHPRDNLYPRDRGGSRVRPSVKPTSTETHAPRKFGLTKYCARLARSGCNSGTRPAFRSIIGRSTRNDALVLCGPHRLEAFVRKLIIHIYSPSSRVATAERKLNLVNDAAAKSFTTTSVQCKHCDATVALEGEGDYNTVKWEEHKASCPRSVRFTSHTV